MLYPKDLKCLTSTKEVNSSIFIIDDYNCQMWNKIPSHTVYICLCSVKCYITFCMIMLWVNVNVKHKIKRNTYTAPLAMFCVWVCMSPCIHSLPDHSYLFWLAFYGLLMTMIYFTLYKDQMAQEFENHMNRSSHGLIWDNVRPFAWKDCGNAWKLVRIISIRIEIRTGYLQHRSRSNVSWITFLG